MNLLDRLKKRRQENPRKIEPLKIAMNFLWNFLRPKLVNFKTTIFGVGAILTGLSTAWREIEALVVGETPDMQILSAAGGSIIAGWGLLNARDDNRTTLESIGPEKLRQHGIEVPEPPTRPKGKNRS